MHGKWAINQNVPQEEVAVATAKLNTPENLASIIQNPQAIIMRQSFQDGTDLVLLHPSGPYTDRALMLAVYNPNITTRHDTHWIYDYPQDVQEEYFRNIILGLYAQREILKEEGRDNIESLYVENSTHVSNHAFRTSRTIKFPHGHFIEVDESELIPHTSTLDHLREEWGVLGRGFLVEDFAKRLKANMVEKGTELDQIASRDRLPLGYEFQLPLSSLQGNVRDVASVMGSHHESYEDVASKYVRAVKFSARIPQVTDLFIDRAGKIIPPPSYRLYMSLQDDNNLGVIIAPEFISHAGVMQAKGIDLDRRETYPLRAIGTPQARNDYAQRFAEKVQAAISRS